MQVTLSEQKRQTQHFDTYRPQTMTCSSYPEISPMQTLSSLVGTPLAALLSLSRALGHGWYDEPQIPISLFREANFGHGQLQVLNATHALWTWHRNQDDLAVAADSVWLTNLSTDPACKV
ncbi:Iron/zinc purple acid phosphatase-like C-terminal domain [Dillenia turbinata]|uniref:Iron/zinc purple acid phosphatase-like C-terminal domain n=1 Tax=Dillenia turbinata TaxID=194707 RepID=A0AAN8VZC5_9MAGN